MSSVPASLLLLTIAYSLLTLLPVFLFWRFRGGSPVFWFPVFLALIALGTFPLISEGSAADKTYALLFFIALVAFIVGGYISLSASKAGVLVNHFESRPVVDLNAAQRLFVVAVLAVSCLVTWLYFEAIGYNVLQIVLSGEAVSDFSDLRLQTYSGDVYFAPGYVSQFKNVLLPITALATGEFILRRYSRVIFVSYSIVAIVFCVGALAGTGQRGYLFYTIVSIVFGLALYGTGKRRAIKISQLMVFVAPASAVFFVITAVYAAVDGGFSEVAFQIWNRFVRVQQEGALVGFRYIYLLPTAWFTEWGQGLFGLLPGQEGSRLAHEIHAVMYGSDRGTVPLSSIGSAYYNGGIVGVVFVFGLIGILYGYLYARFLKGEKSFVRSIAYGFAFFYLAFYVSDAPTILFDNGVPTIFVFLFALRLMTKRAPIRLAQNTHGR